MSEEEVKEFIKDIVEFYFIRCDKGELDLNLKSFRDFVNMTYDNFLMLLECQAEIMEEENGKGKQEEEK